jgi:hypothetical protein
MFVVLSRRYITVETEDVVFRKIATALLTLCIFSAESMAMDSRPTVEPALYAYMKRAFDAPLEFFKINIHAGPAQTSKKDCRTQYNIDGVVPWFMQKTAVALAAYQYYYGEVTLTSAYRSKQDQECVCDGERGPCAGQKWVRKKIKKGVFKMVAIKTGGMSNHQRRTAIDVRPLARTIEHYRCMQEFFKVNDQFGVHHPLGEKDLPHVEPRGNSDLRVSALLRPIRLCSHIPVLTDYVPE